MSSALRAVHTSFSVAYSIHGFQGGCAPLVLVLPPFGRSHITVRGNDCPKDKEFEQPEGFRCGDRGGGNTPPLKGLRPSRAPFLRNIAFPVSSSPRRDIPTVHCTGLFLVSSIECLQSLRTRVHQVCATHLIWKNRIFGEFTLHPGVRALALPPPAGRLPPSSGDPSPHTPQAGPRGRR